MDLQSLGQLVDSGALQVSMHPNEMRLAGDALSEKAVRDILIPWEAMDRDTSRPNFEGRNKGDWEKDNERIKELILQSPKQAETILAENGFSPGESKLIIKDIERNPNAEFRSTRYKTAQAKADEDVSRALLYYSGFNPVREGNMDNPQATDLSMTLPGGQKVMVDAQTRGSSAGLFLGIAGGGSYQDTSRLMNAIRRNPDARLIDLIAKARRDPNMYIYEDKLLQTTDRNFNPIQSRFMRGNAATENQKDFIVSSNRFDSRGRGMDTPYNRERAWDFDLIDLNRAREIILPKSYNELNEWTGTPKAVNTKNTQLRIVLPNELIKRELTNRNIQLDKDSVRMFTGGRRVMPRRR